MSDAIVGACGTCSGTGSIPREDAGVTTKCSGCGGFGKAKAGFGAYRTQAMANRHGVTCRMCEGTGTWTAPAANSCHSCYANLGLGVIEAHPGDTLPESMDRCSTVPAAIRETLVAEWEIIPVRFNRGMTWGESFLGLGSVYTSTDYGAAWTQTDAEVVARVRESLLTSHLQWISVLDADRKITPRLVIKIVREGYSVIGTLDAPMPMLPPTYTPEVLARPI
jgi:hypothetical protein